MCQCIAANTQPYCELSPRLQCTLPHSELLMCMLQHALWNCARLTRLKVTVHTQTQCVSHIHTHLPFRRAELCHVRFCDGSGHTLLRKRGDAWVLEHMRVGASAMQHHVRGASAMQAYVT